MIITDPTKRIIESNYRKMMEDELEDNTKERIKKEIIERFKKINASGSLSLKEKEEISDAIELEFINKDKFIDDENFLINLFKNDLIKIDEMKSDLNKMIDNYYSDEITEFDFEYIDDKEEPFLIYIVWK